MGLPAIACALSELSWACVQYKDRVDMNLIKPAVDWRKTPVGSGTMGAAVAK